jgi:hypothetical protein
MVSDLRVGNPVFKNWTGNKTVKTLEPLLRLSVLAGDTRAALEDHPPQKIDFAFVD